MNNVAYIIDNSSNSINVFIDSENFCIESSHINYNEILTALRSGEYEKIKELVDITESIEVTSEGNVSIKNGQCYYKGHIIKNVLVDRILDFIKNGYPFDPLLKFLENLLQNPCKETIEECYLFLESGTLPITDDGCFLAYKKVDDNYNSYHACPDGSYLNHEIGSIVEMPRAFVDGDRDRTCSSGLHFCSLSYLKYYFGKSGRVVIVKVNPADVCAIPSDYKNAKGRACRYEVVGEYDYDFKEERDAFNRLYEDLQGGHWDHDGYQDEEDYYDPYSEDAYSEDAEAEDADAYKVESLAESVLDDAEFDNFDIYSKDRRGLEILAKKMKSKGYGVSGVKKASGKYYITFDDDAEDQSYCDSWGVKPNGHRYNNLRDSSGRFKPRS